MIKRVIQALLVVSVAIAFSLLCAEDRPKLPIIGFVVPVDPVTDAPYQTAFREGLRNLGWVDGKNITIIVDYANGDPTKLRAIIKKFIALPVDILVGDAPVLV